MKNIFKYFAVILFIAAFTSCETEEGFEDFKIEKSSVADMSGDWYVKTFVGGNEAIDYSLITTSNVATDDGSGIQIFDHKNIWWFNTQSPITLNSLSFEGTNLASLVDDYAITVNIVNGIIVKNGTKSNSGKTTDSISFDIEFSDDPGTIYHIEGFKRTGFLEDEH